MGRPRIKLSEEQQTQIKSMRQEGKTYAEIRAFFKENYGTKINDPQIARIALLSEPSKAAQTIANMRGKRKYTKRQQQQPTNAETAAALIRQAYQIHKGNFLKIVEDTIAEK